MFSLLDDIFTPPGLLDAVNSGQTIASLFRQYFLCAILTMLAGHI
jgi:hypothetical protein